MLAAGDFEYIQQLVRERAAIVLSSEQAYLVKSRLEPVANAAGLRDLAALVARLRREPFGALHATVVEAMTTNETSWFRDAHPFDTLRSVVLPELIARRRVERCMRVWSAACSTGQEPYSLAMLFREMYELRGWNVRILATDLSRAAITRAQQGTYDAHAIRRGLPPRMLSSHFDREGDHYRVKPELRAMIDWRPLNLIEPFPRLPMFDLVFIRNVLIYFAPATCVAILSQIHDTMCRKGYLFLGSTENMLGTSLPFASTTAGRTTFYRPTDPHKRSG